MIEEIRKRYQELYNQNFELFENKKTEIKKEINEQENILSKRLFLRNILIIGIILAFMFITPLMLIFMMGDDVTSNHYPSESYMFVMKYILIPFCILMMLFYFFYKLKKAKGSIEKNNNNIKSSPKETYNDMFCELICNSIIEQIIPNVQYNHKEGLSEENYKYMGFANSHDTYASTDSIKLNNTDLIMSKVHTKFIEPAKNYYRYITLFHGIASIQSLTFNMPLYIKIRNIYVDSLSLKKPIQINHEEFNQYYEIETDKPELLTKYINNNVLNYLVELVKRNIYLEVNIVYNKICIRLHDEEFLNFNMKTEQQNEEKIINSCNAIIELINTNKFILNELKSNNKY